MGGAMIRFISEDGRAWSAVVHDGPMQQPEVVGWEAVVFDADLEIQRIVFRPAGWLASATEIDLRVALDASEAIRTRWQPAGGA